MELIAAFLFVISVLTTEGHIPTSHVHSHYHAVCNVEGDHATEYRTANHEFLVHTFKVAAELKNYDVLYSPFSMWLTLSSIAEGLDSKPQEQMLKLLRLPSDPCRRREYYQIGSTVLQQDDIQTRNKITLFADEKLTINPDWENYVWKLCLLDVAKVPIRKNPEAATKRMREAFSAELPNLDLSGNSVLLDSMDFNDVMSTAFRDAIVERAPFFDREGNMTGTVDLMRIRRKVRIAYVDSINTRVLELPVGKNARYRMLVFLIADGTDMVATIQNATGAAIMDSFNSLQESAIPLEVALPQIKINTEIDMRVLLEKMGLNSLWNDEEVTRSISKPGALPSSYIERASIQVDNVGVKVNELPPAAPLNASTGVDDRVGRDFIANRPFLLGIYEAKSLTCLMALAFSNPTYTLEPK